MRGARVRVIAKVQYETSELYGRQSHCSSIAPSKTLCVTWLTHTGDRILVQPTGSVYVVGGEVKRNREGKEGWLKVCFLYIC